MTHSCRLPALARRPFTCVDCKACTCCKGEYYMVKDPVWLAAGMTKPSESRGAGMLCIGCLEKRLRRRLTRADFTPAIINAAHPGMSRRLRFRLRKAA